MDVLSGQGLVDGDQLGAVGKGGFELDVRTHVGDAVHHIDATQTCAACTKCDPIPGLPLVAHPLRDTATPPGVRIPNPPTSFRSSHMNRRGNLRVLTASIALGLGLGVTSLSHAQDKGTIKV